MLVNKYECASLMLFEGTRRHTSFPVSVLWFLMSQALHCTCCRTSLFLPRGLLSAR